MATIKDQLSREEKETGRIEAFSDGVFAIAITLLILDIKVPHIYLLPKNFNLAQALLQQWPPYLSYLVSFFTILIMWASHHRLFNYIKRTDDLFLFLNGLVLLLVTFVPFPTALLSEYIRTEYANVAAAVYSGTYLAVAVVFNILWRYAAYHKKLLGSDVDPCFVENISKQYMVGLPLYFMAFMLSFVYVPASVGMCFGLAIFFAFTGKISRMTCDIKKSR